MSLNRLSQFRGQVHYRRVKGPSTRLPGPCVFNQFGFFGYTGITGAMLLRRCILCCDTSITRSWHGQCVSSSALKATKPWQAGSSNGSLRNGRISSSIGRKVWSACLPDGSRVRREPHARFCERLGAKFPRPTHLARRFRPLEFDGPTWPKRFDGGQTGASPENAR